MVTSNLKLISKKEKSLVLVLSQEIKEQVTLGHRIKPGITDFSFMGPLTIPTTRTIGSQVCAAVKLAYLLANICPVEGRVAESFSAYPDMKVRLSQHE